MEVAHCEHDPAHAEMVEIEVFGLPVHVMADDAPDIERSLAFLGDYGDVGPGTEALIITAGELWEECLAAITAGGPRLVAVRARKFLAAALIAHAVHLHESGEKEWAPEGCGHTAAVVHEIKTIWQECRKVERRRTRTRVRRRNPGCVRRTAGRRVQHIARSTSSSDPGDDDPSQHEPLALPRPAETPVFLCSLEVAS